MKFAFIYIFLLMLFSCIVFGQTSDKQATAIRTSTPPKIDGHLNDSVWQKAIPVSDLVQFNPIFKAPPSHKTEIRVIYDDNAFYIGAMMYDSAPDSILKQLGNRDDDLNADEFGIEIDTYNSATDAYSFAVTASGVQSDYKEHDLTYNAVWESSVKILDNGWSVEMKIPYSALRFPNIENQTWGLQYFRIIRRFREQIQWAPETKGNSNRLVYWGKINGFKNIHPPVRLSLTPFISLYGDHFPYNTEGMSNYSKSINGGLDLKYGINESFTFDMTLMPDFSQVQSDNYVKNISAFETVYEEQRPFFKEAVDLFQKGDLFYSRRIGHTPLGFYDVETNLNEGEKITKNPTQAKLLNASKVSGRNKNGLAIGLLNAITGNTYATIEDSLGNTRRFLTDPLSNFNIIVFDQTMKNNSDLYFTNTNVMRDREYDDANVTASGLTLIDKTNTWQVSTHGAISQKYSKKTTIGNDAGYRYNLSCAKIKGNFQASIWDEVYNSTFNANDLGVTLYNNYSNYGTSLIYNIYKPFWKLMNIYNTINIYRSQNFTTAKPTDSQVSFSSNGTFKNYLTFWFGYAGSFETIYDYYEPRTPGYFYKQHKYNVEYLGFSSDYRKPFAFDFETYYTTLKFDKYKEYKINLRPIFRINDHFSFYHQVAWSKQLNNIGFSAIDSTGKIIFGNRNINTIENTFSSKYIFKNDLSLSLRIRHYWSAGKYNNYYRLDENGNLFDQLNYTINHDFSFNSLTIDFVFSWQFAPGSNLSIVWKNSILSDENIIIKKFYDNFEHTLQQNQLNSLSLKMIYYLDYNYLKSNKQKKHHDKSS
jgi:hypothetical protein